MTDISHSYEDLGLLLKDKIAELSTKLTKLQKAQEESSAMMQWLQKMNKTAAKWHQAPTPTDTEAVKTQVEQNKVYSGGFLKPRKKTDRCSKLSPGAQGACSDFLLHELQQIIGQFCLMCLYVEMDYTNHLFLHTDIIKMSELLGISNIATFKSV